MNEKQVLQNSFSNLIAFPRLEEANRNAKKQKRYRDEIIKFNNDLDANLLQIRDDLENDVSSLGRIGNIGSVSPKGAWLWRCLTQAGSFNGRYTLN